MAHKAIVHALSLTARMLPFPHSDTANNLRVLGMEIAAAKRGMTANSIDLEVFPAWFTTLIHVTVHLSQNLDNEGFVTDQLRQIALRDRIFGGAIEQLATFERVTQVVSIGAGFDTKLMRVATIAPNCLFYEIDIGHVIESKRRMFEHWSRRRPGLSAVYKFVSANLNESHVLASLRQAAMRDAPTAFVEEAVFAYIEPARRSELVLRLLHEARCGSVFAFTLYASVVQKKVMAPFPHATGLQHAQAFLDLSCGSGTFSIREYMLFGGQAAFYRTTPIGLASDISGDALHVIRGDGNSWFVRKMGLITIVKREEQT